MHRRAHRTRSFAILFVASGLGRVGASVANLLSASWAVESLAVVPGILKFKPSITIVAVSMNTHSVMVFVETIDTGNRQWLKLWQWSNEMNEENINKSLRRRAGVNSLSRETEALDLFQDRQLARIRWGLGVDSFPPN